VPTWLIVVLAVLVVLAVGGAIAQRRRLGRREGAFRAELQHVNRDLAAARAEDRGWERSALEEAARRAYAEQRGGADPGALELVQVLDRPGTDEDKAVFRVGDGSERLTLGRRGGEWVFESLA
jgi:hypothetical protein